MRARIVFQSAIRLWLSLALMAIPLPSLALAPASSFQTQTQNTSDTVGESVSADISARWITRLPPLARMFIGYAVVAATAVLFASIGILPPKGSSLIARGIGMVTFTFFVVLTDLFGQWSSGTGINWTQVKKAWQTGLQQAVSTSIGFALLDFFIPKDLPLPRWIVGITRALAAMFVVRLNTVIYAAFVKQVRTQTAKTPEEIAQAAISQEKQFESFWMARIPSLIKNYIVQMYVPDSQRVAVEGVATQFFALFYRWSVNKRGFMVHNRALRESRMFEIFLGPLWVVFVQRILPDDMRLRVEDRLIEWGVCNNSPWEIAL